MELDDLVKNVKDFFVAHAPGGNDSKTFLSFEPLGHMISPEDFTFAGNFDPTIAANEVTVLSNFVPQIDDVLNPDLLQSAIDTYASMVDSMQFCDTHIIGDKTPYLSQFGAMKSDAQQKKPTYDPVKLTGNTIIASPSTWYDPTSNVWAPKTFTQTSTTPGAAHPIPQAAFNTMKLQWKINPIALKLAVNPKVTKMFDNNNLVNKINETTLKTTLKQPVKSLAKSSIASTMAATLTATMNPQPKLATVKVNKVPTVNKELMRTIDLSVPLLQRNDFVRQVGLPVNNQSQPVISSSGFELSFSYCMVTLQRPWMLPQVFNLSNLWYSLAAKAGFYSTGEMSNNNGVMRALPKAMIVIKDLKIKASKWSEEDKRIAQSAFGFGSFNLSSSSFDATTNSLTAPGIQILGWICEVLPRLPFNDDPNWV
ncbi:hypothetical protein GO755_05400 [Spirosoma sp. HMF4905]|uniref:Uncharacterized protein n=1 Tax=Spirosoma arboris TaxID=2682092 RepID=A0A7K1S777_9BACT|nr:hypothetical protein [Spirosoma arboris]MVM29458.1 hypothetical protein [Spirosoma arboris]